MQEVLEKVAETLVQVGNGVKTPLHELHLLFASGSTLTFTYWAEIKFKDAPCTVSELEVGGVRKEVIYRGTLLGEVLLHICGRWDGGEVAEMDCEFPARVEFSLRGEGDPPPASTHNLSLTLAITVLHPKGQMVGYSPPKSVSIDNILEEVAEWGRVSLKAALLEVEGEIFFCALEDEGWDGSMGD